MVAIKRTFSQSVGSLINVKPNADYREYTSVHRATCRTMLSNDMKKVGKDLELAVRNYVTNKKEKCIR
jgi:hypothetical protein